MTIAPESVTQAGSGLVFVNYYSASVSDAYRNAIVTAEHQLQSLVTNPFTITVNFDLQALGAGTAAENSYSRTVISYSALTSALRSHATTADDLTAVNSLPAADPSGGAGFAIPTYMAEGLGLRPQTNSSGDLAVTLNSSLAWSYGQDAIGAIEHELTEGGFGRIGALGLTGDPYWAPLDLFRFTAAGQRDYTGGADGLATYFGLDRFHVSMIAYHNAISPGGGNDGQDLGDWQATFGDAFGPGGPSAPGMISPTDRQVLDVLGWSSAPWTAPADDYSNGPGDTSHPYGQLAVGGAVGGTLQTAGDRDWFQVTLRAGATYRIDLNGLNYGAGALPDPYLRLHDASGNLLASNDDVAPGSNPNSEIVFTAPATGTYYVEAGAFVDGYTGAYLASVTQTSAAAAPPTATSGPDVLAGRAGGDTIDGLAGDDTIIGSTGNNVLYGGDGADSIVGGSGFNVVNGNKGADTIVGHSAVGDSLYGGQGDDVIDVTASSGHNIVNGNLGNDTIHAGSGGDLIRGGQGDDRLFGGAGADTLSGDRGHDTLTGGGGPDLFHQFPGGGVSVVTDYNAAQGDQVWLDVGSRYTVSQSGADTLIDLGGGTQIILQNVNALSLPPGAIVLA
jgi:Ca2+-binding RTX toxin-like protein